MAAKQQNLSAVLYKANDLRLEQRPIPEPKENEVLLRMSCVGICGSDVHFYQHGGLGEYIVRQPMVIGHEASGVVVKLGTGVKNLKVGDRVAIEPSIPCRICSFCKEGNYHMCPELVFCATPPGDGNLSRYYKHPADFCHKLPDNVSLEEGALLEPLTVGVHACRKGGVTLGSIVLIMGAGPIGLVNVITAKAMGASKVLITDLVPHRLEEAKKFGADFTVQIARGEDVKETARKIITLLGEEPHITIDCCGFESSVRLGVQVTRPCGIMVMVGLGAKEVSIPLANAIFREIQLRCVMRYNNDYPLSVQLAASGKANIKSLITHKYRLEESLKAFQNAISGEGNPIKIMIYCDK